MTHRRNIDRHKKRTSSSLNLSFLVVPISFTCTRPRPLSVMMSPAFTVVLPLAGSQLSCTSPASIDFAIFPREILNPAEPTASKRRLASVVVMVSTLGAGTRTSSNGTVRAVTLTVRTCVSADSRNGAMSLSTITHAPRSPATTTSPTTDRSSPVPSTAPMKSRCAQGSKRKFPSIETAATVPASSGESCPPSAEGNISGLAMRTRQRSA
mmetsp:Transcript_9233/g.30482  ORF Transcript_9233/g.30482 Transcript_9233/m.30482 type:complete len:210 (-) Transcript_9233:299-928(-)